MLKLGWKAGTEQYSPGELLEYAVLAEQVGFDLISVSDHFHPWSEKGEACFVWTWLGAAAARTSKITLGTGVTCPILRYHPAIIAQAAATLASLAPGRAFLGVGTGEALNEYSATAKWPAYKRRQAQMAEAIELIRALWSGKKITHKGTHYQTREAKLYTRPQDPIPLYVSTMVPNSARFVGKHGDGLITVGGEEPETYRAIFDKFEAGARAAGKDPSGMPRMIELGVAYTDNEAEALECKRVYWAGTFVPELFTEKIFTPQMSAEKGKQITAKTITESLCISADPDDHVQFARHYIDLGFNQIIFHCAGPDQRGFLESYGRDVLPRLREGMPTALAGRTAGGTTHPDSGFIDEHNP